MQPRKLEHRVEDILAAVARIQEYILPLVYEDFSADEKTVEAVQFNFLVIGEAARHVPESIEKEHPAIPWRKMRDMRNVVAHGYFVISTKIIWETARNDLPQIVPPLQALLRALRSESVP